MRDSEFRQLVASEFEQSREAFRTELGYAPTYFAFPWMLGSASSLELAKRAGMRAAFGVALDYRSERAGGQPIPVYGRLKCDWIRFLPGNGRASVLGAIGRKFAQFSKIQHLAH
jgi:peptidoglycan/xylan/chitin deacetylase (PgdA/CDA1 family)